METQPKRKSFWTKPEGITGMLFIGAGLFGLYKILPFLITLVENTLYLGLLVGGTTAVAYVAWNNKELIGFVYKALMYNITKWVVMIDPISIARAYISTLRNKKDNIDEQVTKLGGAVKRLETDINDNNKGIMTNLKEAEQAKKMGESKPDQKTKLEMTSLRLTKEASYLKEANDELAPLLGSMRSMFEILKKTSEVADFIITDKESEIKHMERKYQSINIGVAALRSAEAIIGHDEKQALYDQSMEHLKDDMANKLSEMDRIIQLTNPYVQRMELKEAVNTEEANKLLEQFSAKEFDKILTNLQTKPANVANVTLLDAKGNKTEGGGNAYSDILNS